MKRISLAIIGIFVLVQSLTAQSIMSPEETFGFRMGSDRQLINWMQIVSYFNNLLE